MEIEKMDIDNDAEKMDVDIDNKLKHLYQMKLYRETHTEQMKLYRETHKEQIKNGVKHTKKKKRKK